MSKKSHFRGPFEKQHGKLLEVLFKSASQHLYHFQWSLPSQLSWKKTLLLTWKILGLLVNTLAADEKYPVLNRDNLTIPIQMQLSEKQKCFSQFFAAFFKFTLNFQHLEKKMTFIDFVFPKLRTLEALLHKCLKNLVSEDGPSSKMTNVPRHCWNLHDSTFIRFIGHWSEICVRKSLSYWNTKSWDCLLTHWLPMKSILFLIETI